MAAASRLGAPVRAVCACGALILLSPVPAAADAAPPYTPGEPVGVPYGPVKDVFIEREDLSMDLTGLAANANDFNGADAPKALIDARYVLRNDGAARRIDLVFVTASATVAYSQVKFDGSPVASAIGPLGAVPASWMPPSSTPSPDGGSDFDYHVEQPIAITFQIEMGTGRHTLETRYTAVAAQYSESGADGIPRSWQVAFVLSPARQWGGFGELNVSVQVPTGWLAAVRPGLSRERDLLTGHFTGIPADAIAITTRFPTPQDWTNTGWVAGSILVLALAAAVGWLLGRKIGWLTLVLAPLFAIALAVIVAAAAGYRNLNIPRGQESWWGAKGNGIWWLIQVVLALVAGLVIGEVGLAAGRIFQLLSASLARRARR